MKKPFRFFRGEYNGFYLHNLLICPNFVLTDILNEFVYQAGFKWKLEYEVQAGEIPVRDEDNYALARVVGVTNIMTSAWSNLGSIRYTKSRIAGGKERSDRALMNMQNEAFTFVRTALDTYPTDIVTEASPDLKASFVPEGTAPIGYFAYGSEVFTTDGKIHYENMLSSPPADGAPYVPFYGEKFLTYEHLFFRGTFIDIKIFKLLFEALMKIRRSGATLKSLLDITQLIGGGYVYDLELTNSGGAYYFCFYSLNDDADADFKTERLAMWAYICRQKFKYVYFQERS